MVERLRPSTFHIVGIGDPSQHILDNSIVTGIAEDLFRIRALSCQDRLSEGSWRRLSPHLWTTPTLSLLRRWSDMGREASWGGSWWLVHLLSLETSSKRTFDVNQRTVGGVVPSVVINQTNVYHRVTRTPCLAAGSMSGLKHEPRGLELFHVSHCRRIESGRWRMYHNTWQADTRWKRKASGLQLEVYIGPDDNLLWLVWPSVVEWLLRHGKLLTQADVVDLSWSLADCLVCMNQSTLPTFFGKKVTEF